MLDTSENLRIQDTIHFSNLVEVFVDDFIGANNNISKEHLENFSMVMLFVAHSILHPPEVSVHHGEDPLNQGEGTWEYTNEILG